MAGPGATIASETADAVIVGDRVGRIVDAIEIGRRSLRIARQSVIVGIALSLVAMLVAGLGYLTPVQGAILQEAIDVAVILNALRAREWHRAGVIGDADSAVFLRDGSTAAIRAYGPDDRPLLDDLFARLSAETLRLRFHSGARNADAEMLFGSAGARRFVAEAAGHLVGAACYIPLTEPGLAELAVVVSDAEHGRGIGMRLVERLAEGARQEGIRRLLAMVMAENTPMLHLLDDLGFPTRRRISGGEYDVYLELGPDTGFVEARDTRDHTGTVASLRPLFEPRGIAVVGASRRPEAVGHAVLANLLASGYAGQVHAVNPAAGEVAGIPAIPSLAAAAGPVDLAVVCVPAAQVPAVVDDCIAAGRARDRGRDGGLRRELGRGRRGGGRAAPPLPRRQRADGRPELPRRASAAGPGFAFDATFARARPPAGNVAISSQSGAVGIALLEQAAGLGGGGVVVRVGRQPRRRVAERPARVVGGRPRDAA